VIGGGIRDAAKIPELRKRIGFTILVLIIYRLGVFVPTPGIDGARLSRILTETSTSLFGMLNMFSGGALENFSIFTLGITPYISVSIIIQLLSSTVKSLAELKEQGEQGRRVITRYTRIGTIALAFVQGYMISLGLESKGVVHDPGLLFRIITPITLTAGTAFLMWIGEQINERGIGNGISVLIMAGIVARMPTTLVETLNMMSTGELAKGAMLIILFFAFATVAFIVFVERCQRRVPVQYPRRVVGRRMTQAQTQHLPFRVNSAGVIPPIFASALLVFPVTLAQFVSKDFTIGNVSIGDIVSKISLYLTPPSISYYLVFATLIIFFCFFWIASMPDFNPSKIAERLKSNGGFVPGIRPGKDTADYLNGVLTRLTLWGSIYICLVCIIPSVVYMELGAQAFTYFFGGTAVLIVVGVTVDTASQIESFIVARNYEGFMSKSPGKVRGGSRGSSVQGRLIQR